MRVAMLLPLLLLSGCSCLKIGFLGDTSDKSSAGLAYRLMRDDGVDLVMQNGDFDYTNNPKKWGRFLDSNWFGHGKEHVVMTSGNHDIKKWYGSRGYQNVLYSRMSKDLRDACTGRDQSLASDYGLWMSCKYQGVHMVMIGWRQLSPSWPRRRENSTTMQPAVDFIDNSFAGSTEPWRVCMWHRPEGTYQAGHRYPRAYGLSQAFDACRRNGAFIVSGHSHLYSRTKLLSSFSSRTVSPRSSPNDVKLSCGESMFVVSGLGGWNRGLDKDGPAAGRSWIETRYTQSVGTETIGVLVCDLAESGEGGECRYIMGVNATEQDSFNISSTCGRTAEPTVAPDTPVPDTPAPDTVAPDTPHPDTSAPATPHPDTSAPDTSAPDTSAPATPSPTPPPPPACPSRVPLWGNCLHTPSCCATPARCYSQSQWYAQCLDLKRFPGTNYWNGPRIG
eukprot:TRINITY_DN2287_c0_g1_i4.p1 TRINITY_DN2287_c0_g1~~TRINITY_DN2287_c0_g1_i4.p1  ORF type:complete len:447 (+),score=84.28 TRINITY_DN2287_c0_g1_i4:1068-2408(+)